MRGDDERRRVTDSDLAFRLLISDYCSFAVGVRSLRSAIRNSMTLLQQMAADRGTERETLRQATPWPTPHRFARAGSGSECDCLWLSVEAGAIQ